MLKIIFVFTVLFVNLTLLRPSFSQANVEYFNISEDSSTKGAISITFPEGWSTYWKFPGPNGFMPKIRVLNEKNVINKGSVSYQPKIEEDSPPQITEEESSQNDSESEFFTSRA